MTDTFEKAAARMRAERIRRKMGQFVPYTDRFPTVSLPVDVNDPTEFPNIAEACEHVRSQEQLQHEWNEK